MSTPLLQQFPSLSAYPASFLKDMLSSPDLTEAFLFSLPEVQDLAAEVERLARDNEEIAKRNLDLRDELLALREGTAESYGHAEALKAQWQEIEKAQSSLYQRVRPSFLHMRLRHAITSQDEVCERMASAFIEGKSMPASSSNGASGSGSVSRTDSPAPGAGGGSSTPIPGAAERAQNKAIEEFINEFKAARKTYHKRAIWAERWSRGEVAWRDD